MQYLQPLSPEVASRWVTDQANLVFEVREWEKSHFVHQIHVIQPLGRGTRWEANELTKCKTCAISLAISKIAILFKEIPLCSLNYKEGRVQKRKKIIQ